MTTDWRSQYGLLEYLASKGIYPAPAVVQDGNDGTYSTIQGALDAGESLIDVRAAFTISSTIVLPASKDVQITFAPGALITLQGNTVLFKVADGLSEMRTHQIFNAHIVGDKTKNQTVVQLDDTNGRGNIIFRRLQTTAVETFADWTKYDESYDSQSSVWAYDSYLEAREGGSILAKTPHPAGNYFAAVAVRFFETEVIGLFDGGGTAHAWAADADCDVWVTRGKDFQVAVGSAINGLMVDGTGFKIFGAAGGDFTVNGNGWESYDYIRGAPIVSSILTVAPYGQIDARMVFLTSNVQIQIAFAVAVAFRIAGKGHVTINEFMDNVGLSHPGVELVLDRAVVCHTYFRKFGAAPTCFPQGAIKILSPSAYCKIHDNHFDTTLTGKTILEVATADQNLVHDNTGTGSGTGMSLVGAATIANAHNNI